MKLREKQGIEVGAKFEEQTGKKKLKEKLMKRLGRDGGTGKKVEGEIRDRMKKRLERDKKRDWSIHTVSH